MTKPPKIEVPNPQPVTFPASSFDHHELQKGLDKAAHLKTPEKVGEAVAAALESAQAEGVQVADAREIAHHTYVDVDGPRGTETIQVYKAPKEAPAADEKKGETVAAAPKAPPAPAPAPASGNV